MTARSTARVCRVPGRRGAPPRGDRLLADPNSVAAQAKAGDQKGYVSGDGAVETIPEADRAEPVELTGELVDGGSWDSAGARGEVVVVNVWGSWCAPCVAEAPDLQKVWPTSRPTRRPCSSWASTSARTRPAARPSRRRRGMTYPSLTDESGVLILGLQGKAPTVPTTLVLDTDGRIAARVNGPVEASTLRGLVDDVVAES